MKCDWVDQQIISYLYGELGDETTHELESHIAACERCSNELHVYQALRQAMSLAPMEEPSPNLLTQSRIRLEEALDQLPSPNPWLRLQTSLFGFAAQLRATPGVAVGLALAGFLIGGMAGQIWNKQIHPHLAQVASAASTTAPQVVNVSGIIPHPDTNRVEVHYNQLVPQTMEGAVNDPEVRKLLLVATQNGMNPSVQNDSVNLLAQLCRAGQSCEGGPVRTALMVALRYDRDPSIRAKALDGLEPYIAEDMHVRDAVLEALINDPSPKVRSAAIRMLHPVQADSSVRVVMQTLAQQDQNPMIRNASEQLLRTMPATQ